MWNRASSKRPIAAFALPPRLPASLASKREKFDRLGETFGELLGEIDDAREAKTNDKAAKIRAAADAHAAGKKVPDLAAAAAEHDARIAALEAQLPAVMVALDEAGNELAEAVTEHRAEWAETLVAVQEEAVERIRVALAELRAGVVDLGPARAAVGWLRDFDHGKAAVGQQTAFVGGRCDIDTTQVRRESRTPAEDVIRLLDQLVA